MCDLDGIMLVMLTTEFTIVLLFLMTYIQLYANYSFLTNKYTYKYLVFVLLLFFLQAYPGNIYMYHNSYYKLTNHIVASDFYILYHFLFDSLPILVLFLTLIISFFSFFFIVLYFSLKLTKLMSTKDVKSLHFLRKQNMLKQTSFKSNLYTFQN